MFSTWKMDRHIQVMMSKVLHRHKSPPAGSLVSLFFPPSWSHFEIWCVGHRTEQQAESVRSWGPHLYHDKKAALSPKSSILLADACKAPAGTIFFWKAISPVTGRKGKEAGLSPSLREVLEGGTYLLLFYCQRRSKPFWDILTTNTLLLVLLHASKRQRILWTTHTGWYG